MVTDIVVYGIRMYQKYLSPFLGKTCRFYPSCSQYSIQSLLKHGLMKGALFSAIRLFKCHPCHPGGFDPVK